MPKTADLDRLYERVGKIGRIDVLFANAGIGAFVPLGSITEEYFDETFDVNVRGTLFTVQKALPLLNDGASIILTGSVAGVKGTPAFGVYAASKAAVRSFVRTWTSELKDRGIRSNVVSPVRSTHRLWHGSLRKPLRGLCRQFRWDGWGRRMRLPRPHCSWRPMTPVLSRELSYLSMAVERKSEVGWRQMWSAWTKEVTVRLAFAAGVAGSGWIDIPGRKTFTRETPGS